MTEVSRAEAQRRAREWLRIEFEDEHETAAFEAAKHALSAHDPDDLDALIAVGEFGWVRALLPTLETGPLFLRRFGAYFITSGDDAFARAMWPRVAESANRFVAGLDGDALRNLAIAAEAIGERAAAATLNEHARTSDVPPAGWPDTIPARVYGTLGYAPDAPKGRLVLRPEIDPDWTRLSVRNIHISDALIDLAYSRNGAALRFEIVQVAGAYPIRLIFEPVLATAIAEAVVDGEPASLDFRPHGDRIIIPVQLMLDDRRILDLKQKIRP